MKAVLSSLRLTIVLLVLLSGVYPLLVAAAGKLAEGGGKGVIVAVNGKPVGYENIGQDFYSGKYFWGRPSAVNYNAAGSGGSNKGPSNPEYLAKVEERIDSLLAKHPGLQRAHIPVEMVTASGSGLDPHISLQGARIQVRRIAQARNIEEAVIFKIIDAQAEAPLLGFLGPSRVNVLKLNIQLDHIK